MTDYNDAFFAAHEAGSLESAQRILPLVLDRGTFSSAVDVGAGIGTWASVLLEHGLDVTAIDGDYVDRAHLQIPSERFTPVDLSDPVALRKPPPPVDLAICMEVGEHLPAALAEQFVKYLTDTAPVVLFSAAIPHQGGTAHINERWQSYWAAQFLRCGFSAHDVIRPAIWSDESIKAWYAQNTLLYVRDGYEAALQLGQAEQIPMLDVVHPGLYRQQNEEPWLGRTVSQFPGALRRTARDLRDRRRAKAGA